MSLLVPLYGVGVLLAVIAAMALVFLLRTPLAFLGLISATVGIVCMLGYVVMGNLDVVWPAYLVFGGFACLMPAMIADF